MLTNNYRYPAITTLLFLGALVYVFSVSREVLLVTRVVLLCVTVLSILVYMSNQRTRWVPTLLAICVGGSSTAMIMQAITNFAALSASSEPWLVLYSFCWAIVLVFNGGNTAKIVDLFDRREPSP